MITPYNPSRGIDLYVDASGEDDWDVERDRYYLHGFMSTGPSEEWLAWMNTHKTKYEGLVHWANGEFGKDNKKLPKKSRPVGSFSPRIHGRKPASTFSTRSCSRNM